MADGDYEREGARKAELARLERIIRETKARREALKKNGGISNDDDLQLGGRRP